MRDTQLEVLLSETGLSLENSKDSRVTPTTRVLFRRAKQLAWSLGLHEQCGINEEPKHFLQWPKTSLRKRSQSVSLLNNESDEVQVFFATQFLRARLGNLDGGYITSDCARCYYRVIRELYTISRPTLAIGSAGADGRLPGPGEGSKDTAFVTAECARSLHQFIAGMRHTAEFLERVQSLIRARANIQQSLIEGPLQGNRSANWSKPTSLLKEAEKRLVFSLRSFIENRVDFVFLKIRKPKNRDSFESWVRAVSTAVRRFAAQSEIETKKVVQEIAHLTPAEIYGPNHARRGKSYFARVGHTVGKRSVVEARKAFQRILAGLRGTGINEFDATVSAFREITDALGKRVGVHLDLIRTSLEASMYRSLFLVTRNNELESLEDLVFAADAFGSATQEWNHPVLRDVLQLVESNLDRSGRLPRGKPFSKRIGGGQRNVEPPHVIRAIAHLIQHVPGDVHPQTVERLVRYFSQALDSRERRGPADPARKVPAWIRAVSCIALHRVVLMLSSRLNSSIKEQFNVMSHTRLRHRKVPRLEALMWADIGITKTLHDAGKPAPSIHETLCRMRNALFRGSVTSDELETTRAVLMYGPPGTGKSTLMESLALTSNVDLVVVTPDNFFFEGLESLERQIASVMDALGMLSETVILFDEFELMIRSRDQGDDTQGKTQIDNLTASMLPKLSNLNERAKENRLVYAAATNFVDKMDEAAIRDQRFDEKICVYFPDAVSRVARLLQTLREHFPEDASKEALERAVQLASSMHYSSAARLGNSGWFGGDPWSDSTVGKYTLGLTRLPPQQTVPKPTHTALQESQHPELIVHQRNLIVTIATGLEHQARTASKEAPHEIVKLLNRKNPKIIKAVNRLCDDFERRCQELIDRSTWGPSTGEKSQEESA